MGDAHAVVERYWRAANARDWMVFGALLAEDVIYEVPQTRERVRGRDAYVRFNVEFPGDWRVDVERLVGEGHHAASWNTFEVDGQKQPGLTFFDLNDAGEIACITDFWPDPYEPPAGRAHLVERY
jgi:predicted ester cyclase